MAFNRSLKLAHTREREREYLINLTRYIRNGIVVWWVLNPSHYNNQREKMYVCETRSQFALQQFYVRVSLQYYTDIEGGAFVYSTIYSMWCIY